MPTPLTPLKSLRVSTHLIPSFGNIPNTSLSAKPLLIYHSAFPSPTATAIEAHLTAVGAVTPQWRYTMYSTTHYHSTTHEVLAVTTGRAALLFGGESNPRRVELTVSPGDVIVIPAGVGHRLLKDLSSEPVSTTANPTVPGGGGGTRAGKFEMVGAYPKAAKGWDMCYGREPGDDDAETGAEERIRGLRWFERDPVYGDEGPVLGAGPD